MGGSWVGVGWGIRVTDANFDKLIEWGDGCGVQGCSQTLNKGGEGGEGRILGKVENCCLPLQQKFKI